MLVTGNVNIALQQVLTVLHVQVLLQEAEQLQLPVHVDQDIMMQQLHVQLETHYVGLVQGQEAQID